MDLFIASLLACLIEMNPGKFLKEAKIISLVHRCLMRMLEMCQMFASLVPILLTLRPEEFAFIMDVLILLLGFASPLLMMSLIT